MVEFRVLLIARLKTHKMSISTVYYLSIFLQTALSAFVAILAFYNFSKRKYYIKLIGLTFIIGFIVNTSAWLLFKYSKSSYWINPPQSLYFIINFIIITLIFRDRQDGRLKFFFMIMMSVFMIFSVINLFFIQKTQINSYTNSLESLIIIIYCILFFYKLIRELPSTHLHRLPMFWISSAFLIYNGGALFVFIFTSYLVNVVKDDLLLYWTAHNFISILEHLMICWALWMDLRNMKLST